MNVFKFHASLKIQNLQRSFFAFSIVRSGMTNELFTTLKGRVARRSFEFYTLFAIFFDKNHIRFCLICHLIRHSRVKLSDISE